LTINYIPQLVGRFKEIGDLNVSI